MSITTPHYLTKWTPKERLSRGQTWCTPIYVKHLGRGLLSPAAQLHTRLGCKDMFPDELKGLNPVEEKLIALNSCYGFITKFSLLQACSAPPADLHSKMSSRCMNGKQTLLQSQALPGHIQRRRILVGRGELRSYITSL